MSVVVNAEQIAYLGKVAEWLNDAPISHSTIGEFYVSSVNLAFDGEALGRAFAEEDFWLFELNGDAG